MAKQENTQERVLAIAKSDDRIRAVLLNGSRANSAVEPDKYQDFDLVFIVRNFESLLKDREWLAAFGKIMLQQLPDEMDLGKQGNKELLSFAFLLIFDNGVRIDLTLVPYERIETHFKVDSLTKVWLDKDHLFRNLPEPSDKDYHIKRPSQREFSEVCNEFWWTVTNVAKGLKRGEIIYAKSMLENVVRPMFWQLIEWNIASEYEYNLSMGKSGKFARKYLAPALYHSILKTYSDASTERNWNALLLMLEVFTEQQSKLGSKLNFQVNTEEAVNSLKYIHKMREE